MQLVEQQSIDLDIAPLRAHRNAAIFAFALGTVFAIGRGVTFACLLPTGTSLAKRFPAFVVVSQAAGEALCIYQIRYTTLIFFFSPAPLYIIPFTIGLQVRV
jgi:hypothetical protein